MNYSAAPSAQDSSPILEATLSFSYRTEADAAPALPFPLMPHDQSASYPAHATSQNGFSDPQFHPAGPSLATGGSSSLLSTAQTVTLPAYCSAWNYPLSGNIGPSISSPIPDPSESFAYGARQASGERAVVTGNQPITQERERKIRGVLPCTTVSTLAGQAIPANSHPEHVVSWYLTCWNAVIVDGPRKFVPQIIYEPHSQGDKERYVSLAKLHPPIIFISQDSPEWGIPISHLLSKQSTRLVDGNGPAFASCGPSIGIRVQWPGYQPCHKQVSTRDYTSKRRMINKERLAKVVARCVKQFMDAMSEEAMQVGSDRRWRVGPFDIKVDDIILVSLHHVSQGSWQPQLRLRRSIGTGVGAGPQSHHRSY